MKNNDLIIDGYGDNLTINGTKIGALSPSDHEKIEKNSSGFGRIRTHYHLLSRLAP